MMMISKHNSTRRKLPKYVRKISKDIKRQLNDILKMKDRYLKTILKHYNLVSAAIMKMHIVYILYRYILCFLLPIMFTYTYPCYSNDWKVLIHCLQISEKISVRKN